MTDEREWQKKSKQMTDEAQGERNAGGPVEIQDPHHGFGPFWKWENGRLYQRPHENSRWNPVKRIKVTPARIAALARPLLETETDR